MLVSVRKKVKVRKTTTRKVRSDALAELNLLTKYMSAAQIESIAKYARLLLLA